MKTRFVLYLMTAVLAGAIGGLVLSRADAPAPPVDGPVLADAAQQEREPSLDPAVGNGAAGEAASWMAVPGPPSTAPEIAAPAPKSATAEEPEPVFDAALFVAAGVDPGAAAAIVEAAKDAWGGVYRHMRASSNTDNRLRRAADYFFAMWSDLPESIRSGKVAVTAEPVYDHSITVTGLGYGAEPRRGKLAAFVQTPGWKVKLVFTAESGHRELFAAAMVLPAKK